MLGQAAQSATDAQTERASAEARATGKSVLVADLTTATSTVTAEPDGTEMVRSYVLPVRVHRRGGWVPVDKNLRRVPGGRLAPAALPGDAVTFSGGGPGLMAVISASGTRLALSWPGRLPAPVVAGASATYRDVLPGVNLVLTVTSAEAGGFSDVLVVRTPAAARDPRLADLALRVATSGTTGLRPVAGGGLAATMTGRRGSYIAPPPMMWDSASVSPLTRPARSAAQSGQRSRIAGPAGGARLAAVQAKVSDGGTILTVAPDERMLTAPSTGFPVFIDPSFTTITGTTGTQAYDVVQSDHDNGGASDVNCTGPHYDDSSYTTMPVGYDNFQAGPCEYNDTDYALYLVGIPAGTFGSQHVLLSVSFQVDEVFSANCTSSAAVTASWIGAIGSGTGWPGPGLMPENVNATDTVGPDSGSCDDVENTSHKVAAGFNLMGDFNQLIAMNWFATAITLRLWEMGNPGDDVHKQFTDNPDLQVIYTETPDTPSDLEESATSSATNSVSCATSPTDAPWIGKTDSTSGVYLDAVYGDPDGAAVQANIRYWDQSTPASPTTVDGAISSVTGSAESGWALPASYTDDIPDGTVIAWQAQAETGSGSVGDTAYGPYSSTWSATCYFAVDPTDPDAPAVTPTAGGQTQEVPVGSTVSFTIQQSAGDTAREFVWAVDQTPPVAGTIPASQTCTTTSATADCTQITNGIATLTIPVTAQGPHSLSVYEVDTAGNDSGTANGAPSGSNSAFSGAGDVGCPANPAVCFESGASVQANFEAALGAGKPFDNTMISTRAGSSGMADGDGSGKSLDEAELKDAGWNPDGAVTMDGATFTLPDFGSSSSGPDNLLAANQTIGAGPSGMQGSALVVLATSTGGDVVPGGLATGQPAPDGTLPSDATAPAVMGNVPVTGTGCEGATMLNYTTTPSCQGATGNVNYAAGCSDGTTVPYYLTVPDWAGGPSDIAALTLPDRDSPTGQQAQSVKIYAFAVPLDAACTVTAVSLPDVAASVSGVTQPQPTLHIFGLALRNTATATPEASGTGAATQSGQAWTGAFEAPIEDAFGPSSGSSFGNQTIRLFVSSSVSVPAGAQVRVRLSDPGFTSSDGAPPLKIGAATIATSYIGATPAQTPVPLSFGGAKSVTIPVGGDVYSDPLTLPFSITGGHASGDTWLLVSLWLENASVAFLPGDAWPSGGFEELSAANSGNETGAGATPFSAAAGGTLSAGTSVLSGLDVTTAAEDLDGVASPGDPTVVIAGDNLIDAWTAGNHPASDSLDDPGQELAGQLASQGLANGYGVVNAGLAVNHVVSDLPLYGGMSLINRLDRDVLAEPDVGTVVIDEGLEELLSGGGSTTAQDNLQEAYDVLANQLAAFGINVIIGDLTPCGGYSSSASSCTPAVETARQEVNQFIGNNQVQSGGTAPPPCPAGFDAEVSAGTSASPEVLQAAYDAGDHVNLTLGTTGGYAQLAQAAASTGCIAPDVNSALPSRS